MRSAGIAPSNILNFAIALHRLSSNEHEAHLSINLGGNPHRLRQRHWPARDRPQHGNTGRDGARTLETRRMDPADSAGKADRTA